MTLENYISEAVSHGRRDFTKYIESIDENYTLEELTDLLDLIGYSKSDLRHGSVMKYNENSYIITNDRYSDSNVQVEILNIKKPDSFIRVHFGKHTKRIVRVEFSKAEVSFGLKIWNVRISQISELINYLK